MIKTLYEKFQPWSETGSIWILSDPHFDDDDCKLMDVNWITPQEQVDIINKMIHKNDTFICLGDVGNTEWIKKIKAGYKVLITGNHDAGVENYKRKENYYLLNGETVADCKEKYKDFVCICDDFRKYAYCDNRLFDEVYTGPLMISDKIILSHEPIPGINWALNIHGHQHNKHAESDEYHLNLCSNVIGYIPSNLNNIIKTGVLKNIDSLHRINIDKATAHPMKKK